MATLSSILACRIPWVEELGGLQSMGSQHHNPIVSRKSKICIFGEKKTKDPCMRSCLVFSLLNKKLGVDVNLQWTI